MTVRTLAEAAAEILAKSKSSSAAEPMHTMSKQVVDLGGSTMGDPTGGNVGQKAADVVSQATPPGTAPDAGSKEAMKKLPAQPEDSEGAEHVKPVAGTASGKPTATAGHELALPEETEVSDDEEIVSEEEVEELTEEDIAQIREAKLEMMKEKMKKMGCKEDMDALFNGEELTEDFRSKATTIFESAVIARAVSVVEEMEQEILEAAEATIEEVKEQLEEQVDAYLNYMVEEWVSQNEVAIETGLKNEIMEEFMDRLHTLFVESYMNVPEEKVDVLEGMAEKVEELEEKLNEALNDNVQLAKAVVESRKSDIVSSVCEGLTATQAEKVKTLAEGVEFTTEGEYAEKIKIIRENYFVSNSEVKQAQPNPIAITESEEPVQVPVELNSVMEKYVRAISRTLPK